MAVGLIFTKPLLALSGAKGDILVEANRYLKVVFCGSLFCNPAKSVQTDVWCDDIRIQDPV